MFIHSFIYSFMYLKYPCYILGTMTVADKTHPPNTHTQRKDKANQHDERETLKNNDSNILP